MNNTPSLPPLVYGSHVLPLFIFQRKYGS